MTPREIIALDLCGSLNIAEATAEYATDSFLATLQSHSYRIVGPDDLAKIRNALHYARESFVVAGSMPLSDEDTIAAIDAAIRALGEKP